jgi:hypothetical protein
MALTTALYKPENLIAAGLIAERLNYGGIFHDRRPTRSELELACEQGDLSVEVATCAGPLRLSQSLQTPSRLRKQPNIYMRDALPCISPMPACVPFVRCQKTAAQSPNNIMIDRFSECLPDRG